MACLIFQNIYFREHLLMTAFICFRSTYLSEHRKLDVFFIKQPSYIFLGIFLLKESPKKHVLRWNAIIAFHNVFMITCYTATLEKLFSTDEM